jgi:hypothetical protein
VVFLVLLSLSSFSFFSFLLTLVEDKHKYDASNAFVFEYVDRDFKEILKLTAPDATFFTVPEPPEEVPYDR